MLPYKAPRIGAMVILTELLVYYLFIVDMSAIYYYSCTATLNLSVGLILHSRYKLAAMCAYSLVLTQLYGFYIWYQYVDPISYDIIAGILLTVQAVSLIPKGDRSGIGYYWQHIMDKPLGFDSGESRVTIHKRQQNKTKK